MREISTGVRFTTVDDDAAIGTARITTG